MNEPLPAGALLAPGYEVIEHLSRSRVFDVYDAWSEDRSARCIAKVLRPDQVARERSARRLQREGRLLRRLTHPHIVRAYETVDRPDGQGPALILETVGGQTLDHLIEERSARRLTVADVAYLGLHLCSAVSYLHRHRILHLDLKPSNVVSEVGIAKVLDLSIARRPGRVNRWMGTPGYLSPEQARGGRVDEAADVWGIGVVLYEAAGGEPAFRSTGDPDTPQLERRAEPITRHRRLPRELAAAIDACLEPEPGDRPAVEELDGVLDRFV